MRFTYDEMYWKTAICYSAVMLSSRPSTEGYFREAEA